MSHYFSRLPLHDAAKAELHNAVQDIVSLLAEAASIPATECATLLNEALHCEFEYEDVGSKQHLILVTLSDFLVDTWQIENRFT